MSNSFICDTYAALVLSVHVSVCVHMSVLRSVRMCVCMHMCDCE